VDLTMARGFKTIAAALAASAIGVSPGIAQTSTPPMAAGAMASAMSPEQKAAMGAGVEAVIYGLPLMMMDLTTKRMTNVDRASGLAAPVNQFAHAGRFPPASFRNVVRANVDTLYSSAFLDLSAEPLVMTAPDTGGRYYLFPMFDAWTDVFASPGARTTGTKAADYLIAGPGWKGTAPAGMQVFRSPTDMVWILGRTQTNGPADYAAVNAIQAGFKLTPLSKWGQAYVPPAGVVDASADMKTPPVDELKAMTGMQYLTRLAALLKANPPPPADAPVLARLATIGVVPGQDFDPGKLDPETRAALDRIVPAALLALKEKEHQLGTVVNGWHNPPSDVGAFGTDYDTRAIIGLIAFGANLKEDALYPTSFVDGDDKALSGANRYTLHFEKGLTPPVNAFWSVTMYDPDSFFVENPIHRYAISSWMPLQRNADGSLDIYIQHDSPGAAKEANWLPAPQGEFNLTMRLYWPRSEKPSILDGSWKLPPVVKTP
jgi:hypothetical protein